MPRRRSRVRAPFPAPFFISENIMPDLLYLASSSQGRHELLTSADISFIVIDHTSDEGIPFNGQDIESYVQEIASHKMLCAALPTRQLVERDYCFVLAADTLTYEPLSKTVFGKPRDRNDAKRMLTSQRCGPVLVSTGCCLEKKIWNGSLWKTDCQKIWATSAEVGFYIPEEECDLYLDKMPSALKSCGAGIIEGFGFNFCKFTRGSYTTIKGLPIFELRQALKELGFLF